MNFQPGDRVKHTQTGARIGVIYGPDAKPGHVVVYFYNDGITRLTATIDESVLTLDTSPLGVCQSCQVTIGYGHSLYCPKRELCRPDRATDTVTMAPAEAPCRACGRANDVGVRTCWCCGGNP